MTLLIITSQTDSHHQDIQVSDWARPTYSPRELTLPQGILCHMFGEFGIRAVARPLCIAVEDLCSIYSHKLP